MSESSQDSEQFLNAVSQKESSVKHSVSSEKKVIPIQGKSRGYRNKDMIRSTFFDDSSSSPELPSLTDSNLSFEPFPSIQPKSSSQIPPIELEYIDFPKNFIMMNRKSDQQNKNTPRYLIRLALKYLREYKDEYPPQIYETLSAEVQKLQKWHGAQKKNVFLINHLKFLFSTEVFGKEGSRINRRVFRKILNKYSCEEMDQPRSQIRDHKIEYLKVCKIFSLRCLSSTLVERNQTK